MKRIWFEVSGVYDPQAAGLAGPSIIYMECYNYLLPWNTFGCSLARLHVVLRTYVACTLRWLGRPRRAVRASSSSSSATVRQ